MEPQQSIQPDSPDDDPDQDPDRPPPYPSPALLDSALSLVAQPLASAAARVAASHPIAFPLDHLNDFNVDLSWAAPEIDSAFLNDTEYLQLGDDPQHPLLARSPLIPSQPLPSASTTATAPIPHSLPDSQPLPSASLSAQTLPPVPPAPQNHPPPAPRPRPRASSLPQKPARHRAPQSNPKQNPIPIAPRSLKNTKPTTHVDGNDALPPPRSMQAQSSLRDPQKHISASSQQIPDPSTVSASREIPPSHSTPNPLTRFPFMSPHPMMPIMNMYPLQHYHSIYRPSTSALSPLNLSPPHSRPSQSPAISKPHNPTNLPSATVESQSAPSSQPSQARTSPQQPFLSPPIHVIPQGVVPYDTNIMPFIQMAYAAGYSHGVVPPLPTHAPNMPPAVLNPLPSDPSSDVNPQTNHTTPTLPPTTPSAGQPAQQPTAMTAKASGGPVVVQKGGKQIFIPQQKAARLERHPVLGRLQLKSASKPQGATSTGLETHSVPETRTATRDDHQKACAHPAAVQASSTSAAFSSTASAEVAQRQQKKRLVWTQELHERFVNAIRAVGLSNAVPKTIVTIMNVDGLTTEHVKSHLQKYRNSLRKEAAEEERDRGSGTGSSTAPRNPELLTSGISLAPGLHAATLVTTPGELNRTTDVSPVVMNTGGPQSLPFLPSRINAFGGQIREMLQPRTSTGMSRQLSNAAFTPKLATKNTQPPPQPPPLNSALKPSRTCDESFVREAVPLPSNKHDGTAPRETQEWREKNATDDGSKDHRARDVDTAERNINTGKHAVFSKNSAQVGRASVEEQGLQTVVTATATEDAQRAVSPKPITAAEAIISPSKQGCPESDDIDALRNGNGVNTEKNLTDIPKPTTEGENEPSANPSSRNVELELMKEETQQMQLQVQMMVYRTIALEKKLEEIHSERLNAEVSGRMDSSKRSTGGDTLQEMGQIGDSETNDGADQNERERVETAKQMESITNTEGKEKQVASDSQKQLKDSRPKKRPRTLVSDGQTEVEALLGEQMGLQKRLENASALIDKRMKLHGDHSFPDQSGGEQAKDDLNSPASKRYGQDQMPD